METTISSGFKTYSSGLNDAFVAPIVGSYKTITGILTLDGAKIKSGLHDYFVKPLLAPFKLTRGALEMTRGLITWPTRALFGGGSSPAAAEGAQNALAKYAERQSAPATSK